MNCRKELCIYLYDTHLYTFSETLIATIISLELPSASMHVLLYSWVFLVSSEEHVYKLPHCSTDHAVIIKYVFDHRSQS